MKPRRAGASSHLLLAGLALLACFVAAQAAHEPQPILEIDAGELEVQPSTSLQQQQQQQEQRQQQQQQQPEQQEPLLDDQLLLSNGSQVPSPSPSPAPHMATILPLMPMVLPGCPYDDILDSNKAWDFPKNWGSMSVEQQALHPINLLLMNMVGVPSTDLMSMVNPCLYSWGAVKGSVTKIVKNYKVGNSMAMNTVVLVFRTRKNVWVVFRSTDDDWVADFDCMYTDDLRKKLNVGAPVGAKKLQLHRGFWTAYKAVDKQLMQEVNKQLKLLKNSNPFHRPQVWLAGHSLGGALATIAAFKMIHDPWFSGDIAGVVTYGSPRVGNEVWQQLYHEKLLHLTLRWNNHRDLFAALPAKGQFCLSSSPLKTVFSFRHVGKAVLLCPSKSHPGLQEFKFFPKGTETSCHTGETLIIGTHLLGHYFDGWRRAYAQKNGLAAATVLSGGPHVRSVMCSQCAIAVKPYPLPDNKAARNDGVVSCVDSSSCNNKEIFSVVSWVGLFPTAFFRTDAVCDAATALCQVPSAALTQMQNRLLEIAPNITAAVGAFASKALANNPVAQFLQGIAGINGTGLLSAIGNGTSGVKDVPSETRAEGSDSAEEGASGGDTTPDTTKPAKVALASYLGEEVVAEPSPKLDGHVAAELALPNDIDIGINTTTAADSLAGRDAAANATADAASSSSDASGVDSKSTRATDAKAARKARWKQQLAAAQLVAEFLNTSSLAGVASTTSLAHSSSSSNSSSSSSGAAAELPPADVSAAAVGAAGARSRPRMIDMVSGFMAGFLGHLQAQQQ